MSAGLWNASVICVFPPTWLVLQVEAASQCLLALGVRAVDIGCVLAKCPMLLACPPDLMQDMVRDFWVANNQCVLQIVQCGLYRPPDDPFLLCRGCR